MALGFLVDLGDFGSYSLRLKTSGEGTEDEVTAKNIKSVLPQFHPGKRFKEVLSRIQFTKSDGV